jgi:hypothetical protein
LKNIHLYIEIHLRKVGGASLFALGTAKDFQPNGRGKTSSKYAPAAARFKPLILPQSN